VTRTVRTMVVWTGVAAGILSAGAARPLPTAAATEQAPAVQPPTFRDSATVPLRALAGRYVLAVEAQSGQQDAPVASRQIRITIGGASEPR
jgi:hypothetical protein